ncbi:MAG: protein kinase [Polyangiaceae bacterium]|nr:protein kinase [Polyangiaceae bacterium]
MKVDDVLADRFEVERFAGAGGMGQVFRAKDRLTGRPVAVKVLVEDGADHRFSREAKLLAELDHPGIVRHVAHGTTAEGQAFIAMEWLEGETLGARLKRSRLGDAEAIEVVSRMAEALSAAHARGIVHRDVKPGNVILVDGRVDRVKLLDFGIAHLSDASAVMTRTGAVLGTVGYMAPEQARGVSGIDARADVFALGAVLFHCLTGRPPFAGGGAVAILAKLVLEEAPRLSKLRPELPRELDALVASLLAKEPAGRPRDASAVLPLLAKIQLGPDAPTSLPPTGEEALTGAEQRLVAVLIASAVGDESASEWGSTAFESVGAVSSEASEHPTRSDGRASGQVVREARKVIARFGGRLEPLRSGSLAVLLTGAGGSATDLGTRAARCALDLRLLLPNAPMALATGRGVVAGAFPVGDAIDRAAELLPTAPKAYEGIALDAVTRGLLDARFEVAGDSGRAVLLGERALDASRRLLGRPTTTVGRERDLKFLESLLDECLSEPVARAALVQGPAGIGKSRVRYDFARRVAERDEAITTWMARGDPMSAGSPFGLVAQALRRTWGVQDGEPAAESRARLTGWIAERFGEPDRARLGTFLGELARVPSGSEDDEQLAAARRDPVLLGDQLKRAFEDAVLAECRRAPLLLILEDLHWGDLPSVNLVDSALRVAKEQPFMVLALGRPEVRDAFPSLFEQRDLVEVRLGALTRKASERLVTEVLGDRAEPELVARVVERADGNAFYLEELIRAVAEGESEKLPETVLAMVQSRLEALPEAARRVLRAASVFGGVFWDGGVAALIGGEQDPTEVGDWLTMLAERELVTARAQSRFPGVREHVFRHALVREAAYSMLTREDAERGHRIAGNWLEENGEPDALVLAQHFDRGNERERALTWSRTAAEEAFAGNDLGAAAKAAARALEIARALPVEPRILGELVLLEGEIIYWLGRHAEAHTRGEEAFGLLVPGSDSWYSAASLLTVSSHRSGNVEAERALARRLCDEGWCDCPGVAALMSTCRVATAILQIGDYELADLLFSHIDAWAPTLPNAPGALARWQASRAARALFKGFTWEYRELSEQAAAACEEAGDLRTTTIHRHNAGHACLELGQFEQAEARLRDTVRLGQRLGIKNVTASAKNNLGAALTALGRFDEARALLSEAISELMTQGDRRMEGGAHNHLAELLILQGDAEGAVAEAERAVAMLAHVPPTRIHAMAVLAVALRAAGRLEDSLEMARSANAALNEVGSIADGEALVRLALADALIATGDEDAARDVARRAVARLRERAAAIGDPAVRASFLESVTAHRRLAELVG